MSARPVSSLDDRRAKVLGAIQLVRRYSTATGTARSVLNVLATYADADGRNVWIGRTRLEHESGLSRSTLRRAIRRLEELGEVETLVAGAGATSSRYRITLSPPVGNPVENPTVPVRDRVQSEPGEGSGRPRDRVQSEPQPVVTGIDRGEATGRFPDHCPRHATVADPPPCRKCGQTREANDAIRRQLDRDRLLRDRADRISAANTAAANIRAQAADPDSPARRAFREARARRRQDPT